MRRRLMAASAARPWLAAIATLLATLTLAPAASATNFVVNSTADTGDADATADTDCIDAGGDCTLREAIFEASAATDADTITFTVGPIDVGTPLEIGDGCPGTCPVAITGPVTLRFTGAAGPLLLVEDDGAGSSLTSLTLTRTAGTGPLLRLEGGASVNGLSVTGAAGNGIEVASTGVTIANTAVSGSGDDGIDVTAGGPTITGSSVSNNGGHGVDMNGIATLVSRGAIFGNGGLPIASSAVSAPDGLRVGPRRADGTLPLTGSTSSGGTLEVFRGNPGGAAAIAFEGELGVAAGGFAFLPSPEPAPGDALAATIRSGGTSAFATALVPFDIVSPDLVGAVATSTTTVRLQLTEPVDPATVEQADFQLDMAGSPRTVDAVAIEPGGAQITLASSGWTHGEAGFVQLTGPGAITDAAGNANLVAGRFRVAAAPGDLLPPVPSSLAIRPRSICLTKGRRCRRTGATIRFVASEEGGAEFVVLRGNRRVGVDPANAAVGRNAVRFTGRLGNRKLRAGSYRLLLYLEDAVGNRTIHPAIQRFSIRRVTTRRR